jgi:hypothetical protein
MSVIDAIVTQNSTSAAAHNPNSEVKALHFSFEVAAADEDGSVYRVGQMSPRAVIISCKIANDAITGGTDYGIGFYKPLTLGGAVINKDGIAAGVDMSSARALLTEVFGVTQANVGKSVLGLCAVTTGLEKYGDVDVALTADTVGSAAGTISGVITYIDGV